MAWAVVFAALSLVLCSTLTSPRVEAAPAKNDPDFLTPMRESPYRFNPKAVAQHESRHKYNYGFDYDDHDDVEDKKPTKGPISAVMDLLTNTHEVTSFGRGLMNLLGKTNWDQLGKDLSGNDE